MFAAVPATAVPATAVSTAAVSATAVSATAMSATAMTDRSMRVTGMTDRRMRMTRMTDRRMRVTRMNDRCMRMTGMNDRCVGMAATTAGMSAMPMMPAVAAAPADAGRKVLAAPVPAWAVPTVVIPAIIVTEPDELRALDHVQAVGCSANCSRRNHRDRADAGADDRCARNENGCRRNGNSESMHERPPGV
jgi:hypothetical protein